MVDASCGENFACKINNEAWELFERLSENSQWHAFSQFDVPRHLGGKSVYDMSHVVDLSSKVDVLPQKFDQLLSMNPMPMTISSMHDVYSISASFMHS